MTDDTDTLSCGFVELSMMDTPHFIYGGIKPADLPIHSIIMVFDSFLYPPSSWLYHTPIPEVPVKHRHRLYSLQ